MYYNKQIQDVYEVLKSRRSGLSEEEVLSARKAFGENKIPQKSKPGTFAIFISQFKDLSVIILIIAAIISMITGNVESTSVIMLVITLNAVLGTAQTIKADKSLESLKKMSSPTAKVIRYKQQLEIDASELVVGDIIKLEAGDIVPTDARIIESHSLKVNESALTGESETVEKNNEAISDEKVALGDQKNMIFSGSLVTYGRAIAIATAVGGSTELGKIATMIDNAEDRSTPLQLAMNRFSKNLSIIIIAICALVFALSLYRGQELIDALLFAVALAVAAIPEALASIITISLAIGTARMAKQNAIVKKLQAVEGLGCVSVICSDKTGTLTQNRMTVEEVFCIDENENYLLLSSALCNDTAIVDGKTFGDPTETALIDHYINEMVDYEDVMKKFPRIAELPFDSDRKLMSTLHNIDGELTMFTKGAPDVLISRSSHVIKNGEVVELDELTRQEILNKNFEFSDSGLRVLAFASKKSKSDTGLDLNDEENLTFLGLIAMVDPPRIESAQAVSDCISAGIKPIMITGDHKVTAAAIAKKIGILKDGDRAITGLELDEMSDEELINQISNISVYARVSPDNKIRIVDTWQKLGYVVSMTGDGVNDAPALKQADIGIAMGITGTEVSKDAASMVLTDDNFATIIKSVLNGRNIYINIQNAIKFLLSGNAAAILAVLYASLFALPAPFAAVQLLFINLVTDSLPALAISMEPSNSDLLKQKPRMANDSILTKKFISDVIFYGLLIGISTIAAFHIGLETGRTEAMTMAFATLCLARLWHGFNTRSDKDIFHLKFTTNLFSIGAFALGLLLLIFVLYVPFLQNAFSVAHIDILGAGYIFLLSLAPTIIIQIKKLIEYKSR